MVIVTVMLALAPSWSLATTVRGNDAAGSDAPGSVLNWPVELLMLKDAEFVPSRL